jgi:hypothetical protein
MITQIIQTIRCFFWKLKNRLSFKTRTLRNTIDAGDIYPVKYMIYVDNTGCLMFQTRALTGHVHGVCEWSGQSKKLMQIGRRKIVLDVLISPLVHVEN